MSLSRRFSWTWPLAVGPCCTLSQAAELDKRLVGHWQGLRERTTACPFAAWKMVRSGDGKFEIVFFGDAARSKEIGREKGRWKTDGDRFSARTDDVPTADVYKYVVVDPDTVRFSLLKNDPSSDCGGAYTFTDTRIPAGQ